MHNGVDIEQLLAAANMQCISFENIPKIPIRISQASTISHATASQIIERYVRHGFAIVALSERSTPEALMGLGESLKLGEPFIPPLYLKGDYKGSAVSKISSQANVPTTHPSFQRAVGVELHCDGTLQKIGYVKTTIMLCESPGAEGGDTTLFNATSAFAELVVTDLAAALALASPGVLIRQANINSCRDMNEGPAFAVEDGQLVCAYSVTETDSLVAAQGVDLIDLRRGAEFLRSVAQPGSPYFTQLPLAEGHAIILANARISHGRTPYRNTEDRQRCLYRSLYLKHPTVISQPVLAEAY